MKPTWLILCALIAASLAVASGCDDESCATGQATCDGACVNTFTDSANCGQCGHVCDSGQTCSAGQCACSGGVAPCGTICCAAGQTCYQGVCGNCSDREACNGVDDTCNGTVDEGLSQPCNNACGAGVETCNNGNWENCTAPSPVDETCNGEDDDCDGQTDEGVAATLYADEDGDGFGNRAETVQGCAGAEGTADNPDDCDDTNEDINPDAEENCEDLLDNNCDSAINEGCTGCVVGQVQDCGEGGDTGECELGTQTCTDSGSGPQWGACTGGVRPADETCDGLDNDCDGTVDDGIAADSYEANNTCELARGPITAADDAEAPLEIEGTLYSGGADQDEDWYRVVAHETYHWCMPTTSQCYGFDIIFTPPAGADPLDWELCMVNREDATCDGAVIDEACTTIDDWDDASSAYGLFFQWAGTCVLSDDREFFVIVRPVAGSTVADCHPYNLSFSMYEDEGCPEE